MYVHRCVARILGKGVLSMRAQILATPTYEMERSKFKLSQRTRSDGSLRARVKVLTEFRDKVSLWLSFKLFFL